MADSFTDRQGLGASEPKPTIVQEATPKLRREIQTAAYNAEITPSILKQIVCRRLREEPKDGKNDNFYIKLEIRNLLSSCEWHFVYDIVEDISHELRRTRKEKLPFQSLLGLLVRDPNSIYFHNTINKVLREEGIAWKFS